MYSPTLGWNVLNMSVKSLCSTVWFKSNVSFLFFSLNYLFIDGSGVLKSSSSIVFLSIFPLRSLSIWLIYFGAWMLGAYIFMIAMFSWCIDPFIIIWPFCVSFYYIWLEFFFVWNTYGYTSFPQLPVAWSIILHPFTLSLYLSFSAEISFLKSAYFGVLFFNPYSHCVPFDRQVYYIYTYGEYLLYEDLLLPFYLLFSDCFVSLFFFVEFLLTSLCCWFSMMICLVSLFLNVLCLCSRFLFCGYHEVCIDKVVLFLLITTLLHLPVRFIISVLPFSKFLLPQIIPFYGVCYEK